MAMTQANEPAQMLRSPIGAAAAPESSQAQFDSRDLMRGGREVLIRHGGQTYRLRHTRNDKLILVK